MEKKHNITFNNLFRPAPAVVRKNKALALKKINLTRAFHSTSCFLIYQDVNTEFDPINQDDIGNGSKKDKALVIDTKLRENKQQAKEVRDDLRSHIKDLDSLSKIRVSEAKNRSESFNNFINSEERKATKVHDDAYSAAVNNNPIYVDGINQSGIVKAMLAVNKSEQSASVMGADLTPRGNRNQNRRKRFG